MAGLLHTRLRGNFDAIQGGAPGRVLLVGAGPGDPELISVKGLRALRTADVVAYDRLIPIELLDEIPATAERVYVGKTPRNPAITQSEINDLLIDRARKGSVVVRLKGGDPFVFGRGGEEALALAAAGISFEIVPGVSSAVGVPAYAGIPVTHRNVASSFAVVTAHGCAGGSDPDWSALARIDTLVLLMGASSLRSAARRLILGGRDAEESAAVIENGTTASQRVVTGTLATLPDLMESERIASPATVVVGEVVDLRGQVAWFAERGEVLANALKQQNS